MPQLRVPRVGLLSPEGHFLRVFMAQASLDGVPLAPQRLEVQERDAKVPEIRRWFASESVDGA